MDLLARLLGHGSADSICDRTTGCALRTGGSGDVWSTIVLWIGSVFPTGGSDADDASGARICVAWAWGYLMGSPKKKDR